MKERRGNFARFVSVESWLPVEGFPGYEVSDQGRVQSLSRLDAAGHRIKGRILKASKDNKGYPTVCLYRDGKGTTIGVHQLVAEAFLGPLPAGLETRHLNGNPVDNRIGNLRNGTHAENGADTRKHGTAARGERHGGAKLTEEKVRAIRRLAAKGMTTVALAEIYRVHQATIGRAITGRAWKHVKDTAPPSGIRAEIAKVRAALEAETVEVAA